MCLGGGGSSPTPPPRVPQAPTAPPPSAIASAAADKRRRANAQGLGGSTILTGAQGVTTSGVTANKTLLGS